MKLVKHCLHDCLHFLSPACPVLKKPQNLTLLPCYICISREEPVGMGAGPSLLSRVRGLCCCTPMNMNDCRVKSIKGPLLFWKEVCFQKAIILLFFHLMFLIHYCTGYIVVISTVIWIRSCYVRNRKHPSCELKGWNDVTLQSMCRNPVSTKGIDAVAATMNPWHWK